MWTDPIVRTDPIARIDRPDRIARNLRLPSRRHVRARLRPGHRSTARRHAVGDARPQAGGNSSVVICAVLSSVR